MIHCERIFGFVCCLSWWWLSPIARRSRRSCHRTELKLWTSLILVTVVIHFSAHFSLEGRYSVLLHQVSKKHFVKKAGVIFLLSRFCGWKTSLLGGFSSFFISPSFSANFLRWFYQFVLLKNLLFEHFIFLNYGLNFLFS